MTGTREEQIQSFLDAAQWGEATRGPLAGDASTRRYERLDMNGLPAVLMDAPPAAEAPSCPADADEATRRALGYNALARLAGPDQRPFVAIADFLGSQGFSAPHILHADYQNGFVLLEDLGDSIFNVVLNNGMDERPLYEAAIDTLVALHTITAPQTLPVSGETAMALLGYDAVALGEEVKLLTEWYLPAAAGSTFGAGSPFGAGPSDEFTGLWRNALDGLTDREEVLILRDYHADNLLWLPDRKDIARVGLLDFQDGLRGHRAYDLVSLLEDARRDVPPELAAQMVDRYVTGVKSRAPDFDEEAFRLGYALLGLQRNTKILGIFARLWKRDGKDQYPAYMPRLWRYVETNLNHPAVADLKTWYDTHIPQDWRGDFLARKVASEPNKGDRT